jgi:hypothetical protein
MTGQRLEQPTSDGADDGRIRGVSGPRDWTGFEPAPR